MSEIRIFCDGACSGNPGPGAWACIVWDVKKGSVMEDADFDRQTTNNKMEMTACLKALSQVPSHAEKVMVYSDSTYVLRGITQWIHGWKRRGWLTAEGQPVSNQELWQALDSCVNQIRRKSIPIEWHYVRGHADIPGNERCDQLAVALTQRVPVDLFHGDYSDYSVDLLKLPADTSLPPMKSKTAGSSAKSIYVSQVAGQIQQHDSWSECEARVKGVSGAKFKKVKDEEEMAAVIRQWSSLK